MDKLSIYQALDEIYRAVPDVNCKGLCADYCGPIMCSEAEWERVREHLGKIPSMTSFSCPVLRDSRCSAYAVRPLICRLFGAVEMMPCPHGCRPKKWLSEEKARELLFRADALSEGRIGGVDLVSVEVLIGSK
jgi:Fe-S-cluster containining protein